MEPILPSVNLRNKGWLIALIREVIGTWTPTEAAADQDFDDWVLTRMRDLGFYFGTELELEPGHKGIGRTIMLSTISRQCTLLLDGLARIPSDAVDEAGVPLHIAAVLARAEGRFDDAETLDDLRDDLREDPDMDPTRVARRLRDPMHAVAAKIKSQLLPDDHPLLDSPFHRLLIYCDTRLLMDIAKESFTNGRVRELKIVELNAKNQLQKLFFIEAIIGLAWANGLIDPMEQRLIKSLIELGRFDDQERRLLWHCLDGDPVIPTEIAEGVTDPVNRHFLLEQVIFTSFVDGDVSPEEDQFILQLAEAFEISHEALAQLQLGVVEALEQTPELLRGLTLTGVIGRLRRHTQRQIEGLVRANLGSLVTEVRETKELMQLLAKASHAKLTADEHERVKAQLLDICKTIPSLALLVAPGGSILVPLLIKMLPFSLLPSAFDDKDEVF